MKIILRIQITIKITPTLLLQVRIIHQDPVTIKITVAQLSQIQTLILLTVIHFLADLGTFLETIKKTRDTHLHEHAYAAPEGNKFVKTISNSGPNLTSL